jgi:26S proteasome regulatory subunit N1
MMSAAASLGLILLWDVEGGLSEIDKFLYASEDHIKVSICCTKSIIVYSWLHMDRLM